MRYVLQIHLTEDDFTNFNVFHVNRSPYSGSMTGGLKKLVAVVYAVLIAMNFLRDGVNGHSVTYALVLVGFGGLLIWKMDSLFAFVTRRTMKRMKKSGKMPYSDDSRMEFYEDRLVEITGAGRMERTWESVERLCYVEGKVWYLYMSNSSAFVLPVEQIKSQVDIGEFRRFLESKCPCVERFA